MYSKWLHRSHEVTNGNRNSKYCNGAEKYKKNCQYQLVRCGCMILDIFSVIFRPPYNFFNFLGDFMCSMQSFWIQLTYILRQFLFWVFPLPTKLFIAKLHIKILTFQGPHSYGVRTFFSWFICFFLRFLSFSHPVLIGWDKSCDIRNIDDIIVRCQQGHILQQV